ncbi:hypothetical protein [uncultured Chryseobacterium sp.]|uniref:hypothetical protein n=1 Tax=uncultured Chryseobacterium sp. TaxID=259322 RepID=UPI0025CCFE2E|nr:hypothetical protein [uncultured Chryseobacterium sp.]
MPIIMGIVWFGIIKKCMFCMIITLLMLVYSCKSSGLSGSWGFIKHYEGSVYPIDSIKNKTYNSEDQKEVLTFSSENAFKAMNLKGFYKEEGRNLKMKYDNDCDTIVLKISHIDRHNLLLSSVTEKPVIWFYKRIKK